jgi:hypothetical protein
MQQSRIQLSSRLARYVHLSRQFNVVSLADEYVLDRLRQPVIRRLLTEQQYIMLLC